MKGRQVILAAATIAAVALAASAPHFVAHWLGLDDPSGPIYLAWSGVVGTSVFGGVGAVLRRQAERHHGERLAQAAEHHEALKEHLTGLFVGEPPAAPGTGQPRRPIRRGNLL